MSESYEEDFEATHTPTIESLSCIRPEQQVGDAISYTISRGDQGLLTQTAELELLEKERQDLECQIKKLKRKQIRSLENSPINRKVNSYRTDYLTLRLKTKKVLNVNSVPSIQQKNKILSEQLKKLEEENLKLKKEQKFNAQVLADESSNTEAPTFNQLISECSYYNNKIEQIETEMLSQYQASSQLDKKIHKLSDELQTLEEVLASYKHPPSNKRIVLEKNFLSKQLDHLNLQIEATRNQFKVTEFSAYSLANKLVEEEDLLVSKLYKLDLECSIAQREVDRLSRVYKSRDVNTALTKLRSISPKVNNRYESALVDVQRSLSPPIQLRNTPNELREHRKKKDDYKISKEHRASYQEVKSAEIMRSLGNIALGGSSPRGIEDIAKEVKSARLGDSNEIKSNEASKEFLPALSPKGNKSNISSREMRSDEIPRHMNSQETQTYSPVLSIVNIECAEVNKTNTAVRKSRYSPYERVYREWKAPPKNDPSQLKEIHKHAEIKRIRNCSHKRPDTKKQVTNSLLENLHISKLVTQAVSDRDDKKNYALLETANSELDAILDRKKSPRRRDICLINSEKRELQQSKVRDLNSGKIKSGNEKQKDIKSIDLRQLEVEMRDSKESNLKKEKIKKFNTISGTGTKNRIETKYIEPDFIKREAVDKEIKETELEESFVISQINIQSPVLSKPRTESSFENSSSSQEAPEEEILKKDPSKRDRSHLLNELNQRFLFRNAESIPHKESSNNSSVELDGLQIEH